MADLLVQEQILAELKRQVSLLEEQLRLQREADTHQKEEELKKKLYCEHCKVHLPSRAAMEIHNDTQKHKKLLAGISQKGAFGCIECNYHTNNRQCMNIHHKSNKHISNTRPEKD